MPQSLHRPWPMREKPAHFTVCCIPSNMSVIGHLVLWFQFIVGKLMAERWSFPFSASSNIRASKAIQVLISLTCKCHMLTPYKWVVILSWFFFQNNWINIELFRLVCVWTQLFRIRKSEQELNTIILSAAVHFNPSTAIVC